MASVRQETNAATLVERGRGFASVGDHTRAEEYLAAALDAGANPREVLPLLVDVCVRTGRYRSAIQHGENQLRKHPNDLRTRVMVGALYVAIDDGKHARGHLEHVVSKPGDVVNRAETDDNGDADGGARPVTTERTSSTPRDVQHRDVPTPNIARPEPLFAQAHYLLAVVARDTENDVVEADRHFREYLRIEPNGSHAEEAKSSLLKRMP
jgi:tetratricopeptide (TPR) repeat protein